MRDQKVVSFSFPFRAGLPIAGGLLIAVVIFPAWLGYSLGLERGWSKPAPRDGLGDALSYSSSHCYP